MDWKDEFIELYMSNNIKDFSRALEMKRDNVPDKLYRFRSISTDEKLARVIDELISGQLYMAHPNDLNDPFEMRSILISKNHADYFKKVSFYDSKYSDAIIKHFGKEKIDELHNSDDWYGQYIQLFAEAFEKEHGKPQTEFITIMNQVIMPELEQLNDAYNSIFMTSRVACFTENYRNLPMWNHYADSHSGICFEFAKSDLSREILYINKLFPVIYVDKLPDAVQNGFSKRHVSDSKPSFGLPNYHAFHKLADWNYEKEWRLIFNVGDFYFSPDDVPKEYLSTGKIVNFTKPSKIILGCNVVPRVAETICDAAKQIGIEIEKMIVTPYGLECHSI